MKIVIFINTIVLLLSSYQLLWAKSQNTIVVIEKKMPEGTQQWSLEVRENDLLVLSNSNFLLKPTTKVMLGKMHAPKSAKIQTLLNALKLLETRLAKITSKQDPLEKAFASKGISKSLPSPHSVTLRIGQNVVQLNDTYFEWVTDALETLDKEAQWELEDGAVVQSDNVKATQTIGVEYVGRSKNKGKLQLRLGAECRAMNSKLVSCQVPGFGSAFLAQK